MSSIYNFKQVNNSLTCAGQPTEIQLKQLADENYQVIINLAMPTGKFALPGEETIVAGLGIDYLPIPVVFDDPQLSELLAFFDYMDQHAGKKIMVHCAANYRASAFTGLYLFNKGELDTMQMQSFIEDVWQPDDIWQQFIDESLLYLQELKGGN
ncbi:protein tyrosine phosphatase family protein [Mucilaginibacter flavidus]|uniref:protein tyrosine phosphatase family protein n=1 Tax=Mucilaginibacter flavidus TaxID=2949309 RepID=UPI0020939E4E|nr:protein tyrosine phosphatase family protein [Mucilaginibacter flavidus]MCO5949672.1 protein tyrosine phosphatase family protein [Mucilaginibacter flavidus]